MNKIESLLKKLNEAFATSNSSYILEKVTGDIRWNIIGDQVIEGKEAFGKVIKEMETEEPFKIRINNIITQGSTAVVDGSITSAAKSDKEKVYAFCDIYQLDLTDGPQISEITSYVIELNKK